MHFASRYSLIFTGFAAAPAVAVAPRTRPLSIRFDRTSITRAPILRSRQTNLESRCEFYTAKGRPREIDPFPHSASATSYRHVPKFSFNSALGRLINFYRLRVGTTREGGGVHVSRRKNKPTIFIIHGCTDSCVTRLASVP